MRQSLHLLTRDRIPEATAWRYGYLVVQGGLSLLLYLVLAAALSTDAFNAAATALGVLVIAQAISDFGFSQAAVAVLPNPLAYGRVVNSEDMDAGAAAAFLVGSIAAAMLCCLAALAVPSAGRLPVVLVAPAAATSVLLAGLDGLLRSRGDFSRPILYVTLSRLAAFCAVPVAFATESASLTCAAVSAGSLLGAAPALRDTTRVIRSGDPRPTTVPFLRAAAPLGVSNLMIVGGTRVNTIVLAASASLTAAAVFESAWRLFQLGQYLIGGAATAVAPFIASALARGERLEVRRLIVRWAGALLAAACLFGGALLALRGPVCDAAFGGLGGAVSRALIPLAIVLPLNVLLLLATVTQAARSSHDRVLVMLAYAAGAVVNLALVVALKRSDPMLAGSLAVASGITIAMGVVAVRFVPLLRSVDPARHG